MIPLIHQCIIPSGNLEGNTHSIEITPCDIEYGSSCDVCNEPLIAMESFLAAIYEELLDDKSPSVV